MMRTSHLIERFTASADRRVLKSASSLSHSRYYYGQYAKRSLESLLHGNWTGLASSADCLGLPTETEYSPGSR